MKIYVFTYHTTYGGEYLGITNKVFRTKEEALKSFEEWKKNEIDYAVINGWMISSSTPSHYEAYKDGDFCYNHTDGFINEYEI